MIPVVPLSERHSRSRVWLRVATFVIGTWRSEMPVAHAAFQAPGRSQAAAAGPVIPLRGGRRPLLAAAANRA
jgi:hypothetical protein